MTKVLLQGGLAAGRIVEVAEGQKGIIITSEYTYETPEGMLPVQKQVYEPTLEFSTSGYPVWNFVEGV
jgi:hypothetical protein